METTPVKKPRKKATAKKANTTLQGHVNQDAIGIRKTALMQLAESYGDTGLMNPRSIDPVVYMLADMGESAFGPTCIKNCAKDIALTNGGFNKRRSLGFLANQIYRVYLPKLLSEKPEIYKKLTRLPVLNDASYVDYFMLVTFLEKDCFRTPAEKVAPSMVHLLLGYENEQPDQVCRAVTDFFKHTKDQKGFETLLSELCHVVKTVR
jgi:hypothetical protein